MLRAVEGQAFGELADLAGSNAAEKRPVTGSLTFSGKRVKKRMMVPVARFAPVTATAALSGVLVCEAVCAVLDDKDCPQPLLCAQM